MKQITDKDIFYMREALKEAIKAYESDEVPVGAVVVSNNQIIARAYNQTEMLKDTTAHAEILALTSAMNKIGAKYLTEATLYVTLEPCIMCIGAMYWSQIKRIVFGAYDGKNGFLKFEKILKTQKQSLLNPQTEIIGGILEEEAQSLLKAFFRDKRKWK